MTGFVGAIVEAWDELRIHKVRVLLALVGVAVAVTAITTATALIAIFRQGIAEQTDRDAGRDVTLQLNAWSTTGTGDAGALDAAVTQAIDRYGIGYSTRDTYTQLSARTPTGALSVQAREVDPDFGPMYRVQTIDGRWFADTDADAFAPLLVVNETMLRQLGATSVPPAGQHAQQGADDLEHAIEQTAHALLPIRPRRTIGLNPAPRQKGSRAEQLVRCRLDVFLPHQALADEEAAHAGRGEAFEIGVAIDPAFGHQQRVRFLHQRISLGHNLTADTLAEVDDIGFEHPAADRAVDEAE